MIVPKLGPGRLVRSGDSRLRVTCCERADLDRGRSAKTCVELQDSPRAWAWPWQPVGVGRGNKPIRGLEGPSPAPQELWGNADHQLRPPDAATAEGIA